MRVSQESGQSGQTGRGFRVKVNLPTSKDEKAKDVVTYHSWHWDMSVFHHSGWDDWHLLPYVFRSFQGFPGDIARSLGEDATLGDVLQTLDEHCGIVMTFDTWSKELYSLKQGMGENVAELQVQILHMEYPNRIQRSLWRRWSRIASMKALALNINECWLTRLMVKACHLFQIALGNPEAGKMGRSQRSSTPKKHYYQMVEHSLFPLSRKPVSIQEVGRVATPSQPDLLQ